MRKEVTAKMQVDQREALEDPRPIVGIMAHAYANPLLNAKKSDNDGSSNRVQDDDGNDVAGGEGSTAAAAAAAANELVIDALQAVEAETIGPEVRFLGLHRGTAGIPGKKPGGGAWRGADGLRVVESGLPQGLVKRGWLHKHTRKLPGSLVYLASVDVSAGAEDWANTEDDIVVDLRGVVAAAAARDIKVRHCVCVCVRVLFLFLWICLALGGMAEICSAMASELLWWLRVCARAVCGEGCWRRQRCTLLLHK